jgi:hypothetical protein
VLLGSVASPKYVDVLGRHLRRAAEFPIAFVGRGDMSAAGCCCATRSDGVELDYVPVLRRRLHGAPPAEAAAEHVQRGLAKAAPCGREREGARRRTNRAPLRR